MDIMLICITFFGAFLALIFSLITAKKIFKNSEGTDKMEKISGFIRTGANAYLKRQYKVVGIFFLCMFVILSIMGSFKVVTPFVPFAFVTGGCFSALSGFIGMKIATSANARTANACIKSLNGGLKIAFSAGSVMGFTVVGLGLLDVSIWYTLLKFVFKLPVEEIGKTMITFGMGASSMALFARVGGGVFTKAADVGADLVGKVEAGIPEDDPRNPAVIADNVGDNVGDVAGMGADLYESYVGSVISAIALGVTAFSTKALAAVSVPMIMAAFGIIASLIGTFFVRTGENIDQRLLLKALRKGTNFSAILVAIISYPLVRFTLGVEHTGIYFSILAGLVAGILIGISTEYFTSDTYKPTQKLAGTAETGSATIIIGGMSLGMLSTALPVIIISVSVLISYFVSGGVTVLPGVTIGDNGTLRDCNICGWYAFNSWYNSCNRCIWTCCR